MKMKTKKLVLDTAAFVKNVAIWECSEEFFTVPDVINEIKDKQTKMYINALPVDLKFRSPSPASVKFINDFTKKTGDYSSLSSVDVKVLALTYELEIEAKGSNNHLRIEPIKCRTQISSYRPSSNSYSGSTDTEGFYIPRNTSGENAAKGTPVNDHPLLMSESYSEEDSESKNVAESQDVKLSEEDLTIINDYLRDNSYIGGFLLNSEDFLILEALFESFPITKTISAVSSQLCTDGNTGIIHKLYCSLLKNDNSQTNSLNDSVENECASYHDIKFFVRDFSALPHFLRWFFHLQALENDFVYLPSAADSLTNTLNRLSEHIKNEPVESLEEHVKSLDITDVVEYEGSSSVLEKVDIAPKSSSNEEKDKLVAAEPKSLDVVDNEVALCDMQQCDNESEDEGFEQSDECDDIASDIDCEDDADDDEGWITPSNLKYIKIKTAPEDCIVENDFDTACMTADYAMQNTLKHIGLKVMGVDGKLISHVRTFILRCYACFKTTDKMDLIFCKHCGNKTLKKVSVTMNSDGTQKIWINAKRPINIRGTKYSLPTPKGGKHAINPILVADQREAQQRAARLGRMKNDPLHEDYGTGVSPFIQRDVYSRSSQLGITAGKRKHRGLFYWEQKNPNVSMKKTGTSRRKR